MSRKFLSKVWHTFVIVFSFLILSILTFSSVNFVYSAGGGGTVPNPCATYNYSNDPCGYNSGTNNCPATLACIATLVPNIIFAAFQIIASVIIIMFIFFGIKFIMSQGDAKQIESAWKTLRFAIIGLVIVLMSYLIINIIGSITHVTCIKGLFGLTNCQ